MKKFLQDFKAFAMKGNVVDMAVGVIIGAAFGKIVSSLVADIVMPALGLLIGGIDFSDMAVTLKAAQIDPATGAELVPAVLLKYGAFVQVTFDFVIMAFAVFLMIKGISALQRKKEEEPAPAPVVEEPKLTMDQELLTEIRDLLKKNAEK